MPAAKVRNGGRRWPGNQNPRQGYYYPRIPSWSRYGAPTICTLVPGDNRALEAARALGEKRAGQRATMKYATVREYADPAFARSIAEAVGFYDKAAPKKPNGSPKC